MIDVPLEIVLDEYYIHVVHLYPKVTKPQIHNILSKIQKGEPLNTVVENDFYNWMVKKYDCTELFNTKNENR